MEYTITALVLVIIGQATLIFGYLWHLWRRQTTPETKAEQSSADPVAQLRQEVEAGRRVVAELSRARQSLQAGLRGPTVQPEYISTAAELLATRLTAALEAYQVDGLVSQVAERFRQLEEEMRQQPQLPPPGQPAQGS